MDFRFGVAPTVKFSQLPLTNAETLIVSVDRPQIKSRTIHRVSIPGRAGSYDFGGGVEQDYTIKIAIKVLGKNQAAVEPALNAIAAYFSGKKALVFDDTPTVTHTAQIYDEISAKTEGVATATIEVIFYCDANP